MRNRRLGHALTAAERHPLWAVAAAGMLIVPLQIWWFARYRPLGSLDTDEVGYFATALRYHRNLVDGGLPALLARIRESTTGPLVPVLSLPFVSAGGRSVPAMHAVQPLLHVAGATAVAGIASRLGTSRQAIFAGCVVLSMPVSLIAGRSFQLAPAAAAACAAAMWALLASERGRRSGPMAAFGLAIGAMLLARTMSLTYLPGLALASVMVLDPTRRVLRNLCLAGSVAVAVAAPWWISAWGGITGYLLRYGYGDRAGSYSAGSWWSRPFSALADVSMAVLPAWLIVGLVVAIAAARHLFCERGNLRRLLGQHRDLVATAIAAATGWLVLLSSANNGSWFELPLLYLAVPVVVRSADLLPLRLRRVAAGLVIVVGVAHVALVGNLPLLRYVTSDPYRHGGDLVLSDPRLASTAMRSQAASEWWSAHTELADRLNVATTEGRAVIAVSGSGPLMSTNGLLLTQELAGRGHTAFEEVDVDGSELEAFLKPRADGLERILVVIEARSESFPSGSTPRSVLNTALATGWKVSSEIPLPDGGAVSVLEHTSNTAGRG